MARLLVSLISLSSLLLISACGGSNSNKSGEKNEPANASEQTAAILDKSVISLNNKCANQALQSMQPPEGFRETPLGSSDEEPEIGTFEYIEGKLLTVSAYANSQHAIAFVTDTLTKDGQFSTNLDCSDVVNGENSTSVSDDGTVNTKSSKFQASADMTAPLKTSMQPNGDSRSVGTRTISVEKTNASDHFEVKATTDESVVQIVTRAQGAASMNELANNKNVSVHAYVNDLGTKIIIMRLAPESKDKSHVIGHYMRMTMRLSK